ncbi:uncharacterized protein LOC119602306 [Lucilia sericata]|uniref:uncharacterized protein LOC119602306 n=1 Tax=Lucilia sericata TaxID=13632 RepID=UPI0018A80014|nr:uncharacterized protein LOC119602306 [Lucilia sericata]
MFFDNITCTSDDPNGFLNVLSCYLSKSVKRRTFSIELQFKKDLRHFMLNMCVVLPRKNGNDFVLFNLTNIDGCSLLSNKNQATFIKLGRSTLDRFGNIPHKCPFQKDVLYYIRGFRTDMNLFPAFSFEAEMLLWFDLIVDHKKIIKGFLRSFVTMKRNKNIKSN